MPTKPDDLPFEAALEALEEIVHKLEDGKVGLEEALAQYEAGIALLRRCHERLQNAEKRIVELTGMDSEGRPVTKPFQHSATLQNDDEPVSGGLFGTD
jgi:exodeoxyribonuclease VII small subunit